MGLYVSLLPSYHYIITGHEGILFQFVKRTHEADASSLKDLKAVVKRLEEFHSPFSLSFLKVTNSLNEKSKLLNRSLILQFQKHNTLISSH